MKKILGLSIALIVVIAVVGGGTFAYFNDTQTSSGTVFASASLDLGLANTSGGNPTADTTATFSSSATWQPGATATGTLYINNAGNIAMGHVTVAFTYPSINVSGRPTNLLGGPTINFTGGTGAKGYAVVSNTGAITSVVIPTGDGGTGYTNGSAVTATDVSGSSGTSFAGTAVVTAGVVTGVTVTTPGSGYWQDTNDLFDKSITCTSATWNGVVQDGTGSTALIQGQTLAQLKAAGALTLYDTGTNHNTLPAAADEPLALTFTFNTTATNGCQINVLTMTVTVVGTQQ